MPELDPAWEYFLPDPEIVEAMGSKTVRGFMLLGLEEERGQDSIGFRFGRGNPNRCVFRFGREKVDKRLRPEMPEVECLVCGTSFKPRRASHVLCSVMCVRDMGRRSRRHAEQVMEQRKCGECGLLFTPKHVGQSLCSLKCVSRRGTRAKAMLRVEMSVIGGTHAVAEFSRRWLSGDRSSMLAEAFKVSLATVKRVRRKLRLPARPSGNHRRQRVPSS